MARAETIESVGDTGRGGNSPLPCHNSCRMELPRSLTTWPGLFTTTAITTGSGSGIGAIHLHHNHHHLPPLQGLYVLHPLSYPHTEGQDELQSHQQSPSATPPASLLCNQGENRSGSAAAPSAFSEELPGSEREEHQEAFSRQGPLPDLLPQNEHPSWPSLHHRDPRREALQVRRVGSQLRVIGDEFNATVLRRARAAPHWRDWRDACRGLFNFITQTLSTLYRLT